MGTRDTMEAVERDLKALQKEWEAEDEGLSEPEKLLLMQTGERPEKLAELSKRRKALLEAAGHKVTERKPRTLPPKPVTTNKAPPATTNKAPPATTNKAPPATTNKA
eukprot:Hpha_TRINITY_DN10951_c0_g1::TRINITY_DN10951_c0_g1_i2::g.26963::m.26963